MGGGALSSLENRNAKDKIAYAIKQSFKGEFYNHENFSKYVNYVKTCNLLNFNNVEFNKTISLNTGQDSTSANLFADSKYELVRLGNCGEFIGGLWQGKKPPFVKAKVIRNTNFSMQGALKADSEYPELDVEARQLENRTLNYGDIIIEKSGGSNTQAVGRVVIFNLDSDEIYSFSNFTARLRITRNDINSFYLHLFLNYIYQKGMTFPMQSGMSGLRNLDMHMYKQLLIPMPPLEIQKKIVEECEEVENQANKIKNLIKAYEELIQAALAKAGVIKSNHNLQSIFQNINNLDSNSEVENLLDSIPTPKNKYERVKIKQICEIGRGRIINHEYINKNKGEYPIYSSQTKNEGIMGYIDTFDFDGEYVTWTTDGIYAGTCFYRKGKFNCTNVCGVLKIKNINEIIYYYLSLALNLVTSNYVVKSANPKLMNNVMAEIQIPLPPLEIQKKIVEVIEKIENKKKSLLDSIQGIEGKMQNILEKHLF